MIKSPAEIAIMRKAARIAVAATVETMKATRVGMYEYELAALYEYQVKQPGIPQILAKTPVARESLRPQVSPGRRAVPAVTTVASSVWNNDVWLPIVPPRLARRGRTLLRPSGVIAP